MVLLAAVLDGAPAACQIAIGGQGDWASDTRMGVGGRAVVDLDTPIGRLGLIAYGDRYFPGNRWGADVMSWETGLNLVYRFGDSNRAVVPYAGIGLSYARFRASTRLLGAEISGEESLGGVNLLAGLSTGSGKLLPFAEGRYVSSDASQFVITAGVRMVLSDL